MRVLLVTQYFYPENFKSNDIAFELSKRGYKVDVLAGIPNYPTGCYFKGYGLFKKRIECINGVKIYRAFQFPRGNGGGFRLGLNYFSYMFFASVWALFLALFKRYDCVIVHEPSPIMQGIPAILVKKMKRIPLYFWVLDLWPESLMSVGGMSNPKILSFFERLVKFIYNNSDKILISSKGFEKSILEKGNYKDKLVYFPNWAEDIFSNVAEMTLPEIPDGFKIMFAGNIGEAQDFDAIMQAALLTKNETYIKWLFVGDGRRKEKVRDFIDEHALQETVFLLGRYPLEAMPAFFNIADVMLVTLQDKLIFNLTVPAKLQAYMAASRPVVAMLNGEGASIIREACCGYVVNSGDYKALAKILKTVTKQSKEELDCMGNNGYRYYYSNFRKDLCIDKLCEIIG